jgi:hypothetical protein
MKFVKKKHNFFLLKNLGRREVANIFVLPMCDWLVLESWLWELYVTMNFQGKRETTIVF